MLSIQGLKHQLGPHQLFCDLHLSVRRGEHVVIVGGSGSGKSTLLALIAENLNKDIHLYPDASSAMVLQEGALVNDLSVAENLALITRYRPKKSSSEDVLRALNIGKALVDRPVVNLSGGQKRRVAIARALVCNPDLLLFDEPDAGLDVANLHSLAELVNQQAEMRACITVSHNPLYIAQIASKVYRLENGKLEMIASWEGFASDAETMQHRQQQLQADLGEHQEADQQSVRETRSPRGNFIVPLWLGGCLRSFLALFHQPKSLIDELRTGLKVLYLALFSGMVFFGLVGLMLGATTIAVVRLLADNALTGFIGLFIDGEDLISMMGGVYVLYLAPAIGSMLFVARSGSIVANWLGEMVRTRQVQALNYLGVSTDQYLRAPAVIGVFFSALLVLLWFTLAIWLGGVIATAQFFNISEPSGVMAIQAHDLSFSNYWPKIIAYSVVLALTIISLGLSPKGSSQDVNMHTTKAIIYATMIIAGVELLLLSFG